MTGSLPPHDVCGVGHYTKRLYDEVHGLLPVTLAYRPINRVFQLDLFTVFRDHGVIHVEYPTEGWGHSVLPGLLPLARPLYGRGAKLLLTLHEWSEMNRLRRLSIAPLVWLSDGFIFVSPREMRAFEATALERVLRKPRWLIPIGVNLNVPDLSVEEVSAYRTKELGDTHDMLLVHFGFIHEGKQPTKLLEVVEQLMYMGRRPKLTFIGGFQADKGREEQAFRAWIVRRGLDHNVAWRGFVADDHEAALIMSSCDVSLLLFADGLTSRRGTFWYSSQHGCHVITTSPQDDEEFLSNEQALATPRVQLVSADADARAIAALVDALPPYEPLRFPPSLVASWREIALAHEDVYRELHHQP